jgi:rubrerythrin
LFLVTVADDEWLYKQIFSKDQKHRIKTEHRALVETMKRVTRNMELIKQGLFWVCESCGFLNLKHKLYCGRCGEKKPI